MELFFSFAGAVVLFYIADRGEGQFTLVSKFLLAVTFVHLIIPSLLLEENEAIFITATVTPPLFILNILMLIVGVRRYRYSKSLALILTIWLFGNIIALLWLFAWTITEGASGV